MFKCLIGYPSRSFIFILILGFSACTTAKPRTSSDKDVVAIAAQNTIEQDRLAILAMAGDYRVSFDFKETVVLKKGYTLKGDKLTGADEIVRVIVDKPGFISLQHILVVGGEQKFPIKHWRQDWVYEPAYIFDFVGFNSWKKRTLNKEERAGKWAQIVYQVDDSPRYAAVARWQHEGGVSQWISPPTMRPLPRRDMTTRNDYQGLLAINRHAITPEGWIHEQDNTKMILIGEDPEALVRERGINTYVKSKEVDANIGDSYWKATRSYWAGVRGLWARIETEEEAFGLTLQGEPVDLYTPLMGLAGKVQKGEITESEALKTALATIELFTTKEIGTSISNAKKAARSGKTDAN